MSSSPKAALAAKKPARSHTVAALASGGSLVRVARIDLSPAEVKRADLLLVAMRQASPPGARLTRMSVLRAALARGFDALAAEIAAHLKRKPSPARGAR